VHCIQRGAAASVVLLFALSAGAVNQYDITSIGGDSSRSLFGGGSGVTVAVCDQGLDASHPAIAGSLSLQRDFTNSGTYNESNGNPGHGTGLASLLVGHASDYKGLAPSAKLINARIVSSNDWTTDTIAGNGILWSAQNGARVINLSIGGTPSSGRTTEKLNLIVDYVANRYNASIVAAAGNEGSSAVNYVPGGSYNGYSVGALQSSRYNQVAGFSNYAMDYELRTKPDLVAPGMDVSIARADWEKGAAYGTDTGTSYSAPMAGGVLAQMIGYGKAKGLSTRSYVLKSILLTSAKKVWDDNGVVWSPRDGLQDPDVGPRIDQPLDNEQGAGKIDAVAAYYLYAKKTTASMPFVNWKYSTLSSTATSTMSLGSLKAGQRVDATLTWMRQVGYTDTNNKGTVDGADKFYLKASLADFALMLLKDGKPVITSDSDVDNVEHISWKLSSSGTYSLAAYRTGTSGLSSEQYALAARVLSSPPLIQNLPGAPPTAPIFTSSAGVTKSLNLSTAVVPEPSSLLLAALGATILAARRRRIAGSPPGNTEDPE
jgi:hypothetical protein